MILCLMSNAYGNESDVRFSVSAESMENGTASSVGIYSGVGIFYGGVSLNYIESSKVIQWNNRKTILPIYFFVGLKARTKISPFIEAAIDLPEAFIDDLLNNEEESEAQADYYFSGGLEFKATEKVSFSVYAKKYNFIFRENIISPTMKTRPRSYGAGVSIRF